MKDDKTRLSENPLVVGHIEKALAFHAVRREYFQARIERLVERGELDPRSPLQAIFWVWWTQLTALGEISSDLQIVGEHEVLSGAWMIERGGVVPELPYRLDFAVLPDRMKFGIECDGHGFHERTPEDVAHRDQRDRHLASWGWEIQHYSYAEFVRDPYAAIRFAADRAAQILRRIEGEVGAA